MNLSRAAKKFRDSEEPKESRKKAAGKKPTPAPAPQPVKPPETAKAPQSLKEPEPLSAPADETAEPASQEIAELTPAPESESGKKKRPRFVFVRQKAERQEASTPPSLPQPSKKVFAKLMTKNLALPPKEEPTKAIRG